MPYQVKVLGGPLGQALGQYERTEEAFPLSTPWQLAIDMAVGQVFSHILRGLTAFWKPLWRTGRYHKSFFAIGVMESDHQESDSGSLRSIRRSSLHHLGAEGRKARIVHVSRILNSMGAPECARKLRTSYEDAVEELAGFEHG